MVSLSDRMSTKVKPRLLVIQCWALGDLAISLPFMRAALEKYEVFLLAKPYASDLIRQLIPEVTHLPFEAPWTRFRGKYALHQWPWATLGHGLRNIRKHKPDVAVSARWDPRDHLLMILGGARKRIGFPRMGSGFLLTDRLDYGKDLRHRHEDWRRVATTLNVDLPPISDLQPSKPAPHLPVLIHSGAAQKVRVWPLDRYLSLVRQIRSLGFKVSILCDPDQVHFWEKLEPDLQVPGTISALIDAMKRGSSFIGNDSGPGHLAAVMGLPTLTLFGPQLPVWFTPPHPRAEWIEGRPCPYKPCFDYCRFESPHCLLDITESEVVEKTIHSLQKWGIQKHEKPE